MIAPEPAPRGGCGLTARGRDFERFVKMLEHELPSTGRGVVRCALVLRQAVDRFAVFHAGKRDRRRMVDAEGLQIAREHLHCCDASGRKFREEVTEPRGKRRALAPEAQARGIGHVADLGRTSGRRIDDAGERESLLQVDERAAGLGRLARAGRDRVLALVTLVDDDDGLTPEPPDDLVQARAAGLRLCDHRRVGRKEHAVKLRDGRVGSKVGDRCDLDVGAKRREVGRGRVLQGPRNREPQGATTALHVVVEDDRGNCAAFAHPCPVTEEVTGDRSVAEPLRVARARGNDAFELDVRDPAFRDNLGWKCGTVRHLGRVDRGHRRRLDEACRMPMSAGKRPRDVADIGTRLGLVVRGDVGHGRLRCRNDGRDG